MHFRFRGNNIQVVKSQTDPASGKAKSVPVGSINRAKLSISEKLAESCSPEELREIETWVKRYQNVESLKRKVAALTLPEQIAAAVEWLKDAKPEEIQELADDLIGATSALRRVLTKRGLL